MRSRSSSRASGFSSSAPSTPTPRRRRSIATWTRFPPSSSRRSAVCSPIRSRASSRSSCYQGRGPGRVAAHEILLGSPALASLIREAKIQQIASFIQSGAAEGMQAMDAALERLVQRRHREAAGRAREGARQGVVGNWCPGRGPRLRLSSCGPARDGRVRRPAGRPVLQVRADVSRHRPRRRRPLHEHEARSGGSPVEEADGQSGADGFQGGGAARECPRWTRCRRRIGLPSVPSLRPVHLRGLAALPDPGPADPRRDQGRERLRPARGVVDGLQGADAGPPRCRRDMGRSRARVRPAHEHHDRHAAAALAANRVDGDLSHDRRLSRRARLAREVRLHRAAVHVHAPVPEDGPRALLPVQGRRARQRGHSAPVRGQRSRASPASGGRSRRSEVRDRQRRGGRAAASRGGRARGARRDRRGRWWRCPPRSMASPRGRRDRTIGRRRRAAFARSACASRRRRREPRPRARTASLALELVRGLLGATGARARGRDRADGGARRALAPPVARS